MSFSQHKSIQALIALRPFLIFSNWKLMFTDILRPVRLGLSYFVQKHQSLAVQTMSRHTHKQLKLEVQIKQVLWIIDSGSSEYKSKPHFSDFIFEKKTLNIVHSFSLTMQSKVCGFAASKWESFREAPFLIHTKAFEEKEKHPMIKYGSRVRG